MARSGGSLREDEVGAILDFVSKLTLLESLDEFRAAVPAGLRRLVPCEIVSLNELDFERGEMAFTADPADSLIDDGPEVFARLGHQNPLIERYQRTRDGRPYKWSDFITRRQLHATELYREAYARMEVEYQIAMCLPAPPQLIVAFALNRSRRDFSEHERRLLNLVRAPLIHAYRSIQRYADLVARLHALEQGLERGGTGVILLAGSGDGREISFVSDEAARTLAIEGDATVDPGLLPAQLRLWLSGISPNGLAAPPLVLSLADGVEALVQYLPPRGPDGRAALLIESAGELLSIQALRAAGLTPREAQVMRLVALGRTNPQIAETLQISPRTVQKHLEHVYDKLGARSRTQAVVTAWAIEQGGAERSATPAVS